MTARKISIKYCGGCNPRFDRSAFIAGIKQEFPQFEWLGTGDTEACLALVVCGCNRICASQEDLEGLEGKMLISAPEDFAALREELLRILALTMEVK